MIRLTAILLLLLPSVAQATTVLPYTFDDRAAWDAHNFDIVNVGSAYDVTDAVIDPPYRYNTAGFDYVINGAASALVEIAFLDGPRPPAVFLLTLTGGFFGVAEHQRMLFATDAFTIKVLTPGASISLTQIDMGPAAPIPLPASAPLLLGALALLAIRKRHRRMSMRD